MSEMVERVARALFVKAWGEPNYWSEEEDEMEAIFRPNARVAIEAMARPTEKMDLAGVEAESFRSLGLLKVHHIWRVMIEAALN